MKFTWKYPDVWVLFLDGIAVFSREAGKGQQPLINPNLYKNSNPGPALVAPVRLECLIPKINTTHFQLLPVLSKFVGLVGQSDIFSYVCRTKCPTKIFRPKKKLSSSVTRIPQKMAAALAKQKQT